MAGGDWQPTQARLTRSLMRVLLVYALLLQALVPLSVARSEAHEGVGGGAFLLCSMTGGVDNAAQPAEKPARIAPDCLSCCFGTVPAALAPPAGLAEPAGFYLPVKLVAPSVIVRRFEAGGPPPQRSPPGLV